jgi:hypothetical protein
MGMDAPHATCLTYILINLKVSEAACLWMRSVNAWVWMRRRLPDPFSSNLKVSEAACVNVESGCMGMDASHATA